MANEYATAEEFKQAVRVEDTDDDDGIDLALAAASRSVDDHCNRRFWLDPTAVARYFDYDPRFGAVFVDDIGSLVDLAVAVDQVGDGAYSDAWTLTTHYRLAPRNAAADGVPWSSIVTANNGTKSFPRGEGLVKVTARFGWPATPDPVKQATLIQANRFWKRKDSPYGVAGSAELGSELRLLASLDPDAVGLLKPFRRAKPTGVAIVPA